MVDPSTARVRRDLPAPLPEGQAAELRATRYGEANVSVLVPKAYGMPDEGSYFVTTNPTPGTGIATIAALQTFVATSPFILMWNANPYGGKRVYLDYLKLRVTAAGTGGTKIEWACTRDEARTDRYTSGTGTITAPVNVNGDSDRASKVTVYAGALVAATAPNAKLLGHGAFRTVIPVVGDEYLINFGGVDMMNDGVLVSGTAIVQRSIAHPGIVLGPQQWFGFHIWLASQSAASSYEVEIGHWER